ncbi:hypothetical protein QL285_033927 [Trifolium repens]|nr:hypothetical protein QL285_033927 [Trifolium repens]
MVVKAKGNVHRLNYSREDNLRRGVCRSKALAKKVTKLAMLMRRVGFSMIFVKLDRRKAAALTGLLWEIQNMRKSSSFVTVVLFGCFPKNVWAMII